MLLCLCLGCKKNDPGFFTLEYKKRIGKVWKWDGYWESHFVPSAPTPGYPKHDSGRYDQKEIAISYINDSMIVFETNVYYLRDIDYTNYIFSYVHEDYKNAWHRTATNTSYDNSFISFYYLKDSVWHFSKQSGHAFYRRKNIHSN